MNKNRRAKETGHLKITEIRWTRDHYHRGYTGEGGFYFTEIVAEQKDGTNIYVTVTMIDHTETVTVAPVSIMNATLNDLETDTDSDIEQELIQHVLTEGYEYPTDLAPQEDLQASPYSPLIALARYAMYEYLHVSCRRQDDEEMEESLDGFIGCEAGNLQLDFIPDVAAGWLSEDEGDAS